MGEFLKWIGRFFGGPVSLIGDNLKFLSNSIFGTDFSNRYNDIYNIFNGSYVPEDSHYGTSAEIQNSGFLSDVQNLLHSVAGRYVGTELTGAEREQNAWTALREDSRYQNAVVDMQSAGLNPALMYGGASTPSVNSSAGGIAGSGSLADFLQFAMLPLQMKALNAEIGKTESETNKLNEETSGVHLDNEFKQNTLDARTEAVELANSLSRSQIKVVDNEVEKIAADTHKLSEEAKTEESKRELNFAAALLDRMNAYQIVQMLPYAQALASAQTEAQSNYAALMAVQTLYQNKLISAGYIDAVCAELKASATSAEARAAIDQVNSDLRTGKFGNDGSFLGKVGSSLLQGTVLTLDQLRGIASIGIHFGKSLGKSDSKSNVNPGYSHDPFGYLAGE